MRKAKARRIIASWVCLAFLAFAVYRAEQASFGSAAGKIWGAAVLILLLLCFFAWCMVGDATERIRAAASADGLFILEALGEHGDTTYQPGIDRAIRPLVRSVAVLLKSGEHVPDTIRSEAIRISELELGRTAEVDYVSSHEAAGLLVRRRPIH